MFIFYNTKTEIKNLLSNKILTKSFGKGNLPLIKKERRIQYLVSRTSLD